MKHTVHFEYHITTCHFGMNSLSLFNWVITSPCMYLNVLNLLADYKYILIKSHRSYLKHNIQTCKHWIESELNLALYHSVCTYVESNEAKNMYKHAPVKLVSFSVFSLQLFTTSMRLLASLSSMILYDLTVLEESIIENLDRLRFYTVFTFYGKLFNV